jgi:hypothetical protein
MKISRRVPGFILFGSTLLLLGMLFWPFILNEIIKPISLATWIVLRIFVLSVDQKYYWGAIIFVTVVFLFRLLPQDQTDIQSEDFQDSNTTIKTIEYWQVLLTITGHDARDEKSLKRELINLLLSLYASKQRTSTNFRLYDALQRGEFALPEHIHTFLFPDELQESKRSVKKFIQSIRNTPRKWMRRWTGQETAEHYQMIDEVLCFIERSMEIKNDDGKFTQNKH